MQATRVFFDKFGSYDVLYTKDIEIGDVKDDEIILKVIASGINPVDTKIRSGTSFLCNVIKAPMPWSLGTDVSGIVIKAGSRALFKEGDIVFGSVGKKVYPRSYSTHIKTRGKTLVKLPNISKAQEAGALVTAGVTAYNIKETIDKFVVSKNYKDNKDVKILVSGALGGVGHILMQLLINDAFNVSSLCSLKDDAFLNTLKLYERLSYKDDNSKLKESFDVVVDNIGFDVGVALFDYVKDDGLLLTVPTMSFDYIKAQKPTNKNFATVLAHSDNDLLNKLGAMLYRDEIKVNITKKYNLKDIKNAHKQIESGHTHGKLIAIG